MPKVDVNPLGSGGTVELTSADGWKQMASYVVGFSFFFALLGLGQQGSNKLTNAFGSLTGMNTGERQVDIPVAGGDQ